MAKSERKNKKSRGATSSERIVRSKDSHKKKSTRGATRDNSHVKSEPRRWGRYVASVFVGVLFLQGIFLVDWAQLVRKAEGVAYRPVANVLIEGQFVYISKEKIQTMLSDRLSGDFVDIDLQSLKLAIEENPWIAKVSIQRNWPDNLKIEISEEKPIARWDNKGFINREGKLIHANIENHLDTLPLLSGDEKKSAEIAQYYLLFTKLLNKSDLYVRGLRVDEKYSWDVFLNENIQLKLGSGDIKDKLENFLFVYDGYLAKTDKKIQVIDMRYDHGMAVKWSDGSEGIKTTELASLQE